MSVGERPIYFLELHFSSGVQRFCTADADITWLDVVWLGAGRILSVDQKVNQLTLENSGWTVTMSAIPVELASLALLEPVYGRAWTLVANIYDEAGAYVRTAYTESGIMSHTELHSDEAPAL